MDIKTTPTGVVGARIISYKETLVKGFFEGF